MEKVLIYDTAQLNIGKLISNLCQVTEKVASWDIISLDIPLKIYSLAGNRKNDLVKYFMQHIRNGLIIDLITS